MADRTIGGLPPVAELYDDSLLAVEQQGEACRICLLYTSDAADD